MLRVGLCMATKRTRDKYPASWKSNNVVRKRTEHSWCGTGRYFRINMMRYAAVITEAAPDNPALPEAQFDVAGLAWGAGLRSATAKHEQAG